MVDVYKCIVLGDADVGKTSLILQWVDGTFQLKPENIDYKSRILEIGESTIKLQIADTAGQERFRTLTSSYFRETDVIMVVFDLTVAESWKNVTTWIDESTKYANDDALIFLVGNKIDLVEEEADARLVSSDDVQKYIENRGLAGYLETSAKSGKNVDELFMGLVKRLMDRDAGVAAPPPVTKTTPAKVEQVRKRRCLLF